MFKQSPAGEEQQHPLANVCPTGESCPEGPGGEALRVQPGQARSAEGLREEGRAAPSPLASTSSGTSASARGQGVGVAPLGTPDPLDASGTGRDGEASQATPTNGGQKPGKPKSVFDAMANLLQASSCSPIKPPEAPDPKPRARSPSGFLSLLRVRLPACAAEPCRLRQVLIFRNIRSKH